MLPPPVMAGAGGSSAAGSGRADGAGAAAGSEGGTTGEAFTAAGARGGDSGSSSGAAGAQALVPAPRHPRGQLDLELGSLPHLFVSFGNAAYFPFVHNWARSVQAMGAPYFVAGAPWAGGRAGGGWGGLVRVGGDPAGLDVQNRGAAGGSGLPRAAWRCLSKCLPASCRRQPWLHAGPSPTHVLALHDSAPPSLSVCSC